MATGLLAAGLLFGVHLAIVPPASAQEPTLDEVKAEAQARANRNGYPLEGLKPDEVREALSRLTSMDRDEWAASWNIIGDHYMTKAQRELSSAPTEADNDFVQAWLIVGYGSGSTREVFRRPPRIYADR